MANPQALKKFEQEPLSMRLIRGFCSTPEIYETYSTQYREFFREVWVAVENDELTEEEGRELLEDCRNVSDWT